MRNRSRLSPDVIGASIGDSSNNALSRSAVESGAYTRDSGANLIIHSAAEKTDSEMRYFRTRVDDTTRTVYPNSVLLRIWKPACVCSWVCFVLMQAYVYLNRHYSSVPLCPNTDRNYGSVYWGFYYTVFGGFLISCFSILTKLITLVPTPGINSRIELAPLAIALSIVAMGTSM
jgi:hypothetical protein